MSDREHIQKVAVDKVSQRPPWKDIPEGGGLNANYTLVDAVARICNYLGRFGFEYGVDFYWLDRDSISVSKGQSLSAVSFVFNNKLAEMRFKEFVEELKENNK